MNWFSTGNTASLCKSYLEKEHLGVHGLEGE